MAYEMRKTESLATLLKYSGGFTGDAFKKLLRVLRKSEDLKSVYNVEEFELAEFKVEDGDSVIVDSMINRFKNMSRFTCILLLYRDKNCARAQSFSPERRILYHKSGCRVNSKRKKFAPLRTGFPLKLLLKTHLLSVS